MSTYIEAERGEMSRATLDAGDAIYRGSRDNEGEAATLLAVWCMRCWEPLSFAMLS